MKEPMNHSIRELIAEKSTRRTKWAEIMMPKFFLLCAIISILTTIGIVLTLFSETFSFFREVSILEFITSAEWYPLHNDPSYGIRPLITGTLVIAAIAMCIAIPIGLATAIYLSEYATDKTRRTIKPILEVLAGIPTIVYGFFALTFVTPLLQRFIPDVSIYNALSPGLVVGIMIIPMVASLSEDAMSAVPRSMREGAFALGSTRFEVAVKVVLPAALSGVIASFVLAVSRAIGETMIVTVAGGSNPTTSLDVTSAVQTMTAYIVQISLGDAGYGTTEYYSIYAVGMTLFIFTLLMNVLAHFISKRFREVY
ncbi:phosphate ABC transporter permease subunit PstC [Alteribacillus iranensis]|uniref:Phosphate transport system permease protein n=1 Tax=Alteribacillus iranensis TaxID=930128 RepID=A0A1I2CSK7_9BACI|nr:phosphate ABC transporter permease subunit PstC [Alteribacillus iranensis]SFE71327.1 phosphate ABC transporter membrane protein 1, PhoT family [Alteribacillus iranensis]